MPRRIEVEILADVSQLLRGYREAAAGTQKFEREMTGSVNRIKGSLKGFALGAGAYIGISGLASAFDTVVKAGIDAQVSQKALAAQLKASGESFKQNQQAIDRAGLSLGKYGFTIEESQHALAVLDRATGSVTKAMQIQGVAANVAAATGRPLAQISLILGKAYDGQTASLKRLGVVLPKHISGMEAIYIVAKKYAGQGLANTTIEKQFGVALHNTEVIIGTALLPTVDRLLGRLTDWLDKLNRSGRLQRDVNTAVKDATAAFQGARAVLGPLIGAFKDLTSAVGGTKHMVELLVAAFLAFKTAKVLGSIASAAQAITGIGGAAETSLGQVLKLRAGILAIPTLALTDIILGKKAFTTQATAGDVSGAAGSPYPKGTALNDVYQAAVRGQIRGILQQPGGGTMRLGGLTGGLLQAQLQGYQQYLGRFFGGVVGKVAGFGAGGGANVPGRVSGAGGGSAWETLRNALARDPNNLGLLRQEVTLDRSALAFLAKQRAQGKITRKQYDTEYRNYWNDINSTLGTISSITSAAASAVKATRDKAAAAARKAAEARRKAAREQAQDDREQAAAVARQLKHERDIVAAVNRAFKAYGAPLTSYQAPLRLQVAEARAVALGGTGDAVARRIRAAARKALESGHLALTAQKEAWDLIASVNQQLKSQTSQFVIKYQRGLRGTQPAYHVGGGHITINGGVHLHGIHDVTQMENELEARAKRRPVTRRGR
jgi:hypothetical protein